MASMMQSELYVRLSFFVGAFAVMAALEYLWPRRRLVLGRLKRWPANLGIIALGSLFVRVLAALSVLLVVPFVAVAAGAFAEQKGWGLLNLVTWPTWLKVTLAIVILDFAMWLQHLLSHRIQLLWLVHRMHHADRDIDVSTALRFHPFEIGVSMLYKVVWVLAIGASPVAVLAFEVILNALAMFNHANVAFHPTVERVLRAFVVTPDMHRVHHSVSAREHHSNYGFNLSIWDRLFSTYVAEPRDGHEGMTIGLSEFQTDTPARIGWCLALPFRRRNI